MGNASANGSDDEDTATSAEQSFSDVWEIEAEPIGRGNFSEVFYACRGCHQPDKRCTLKDISQDTAAVLRASREIEILQALGTHGCLVSLVDYDDSVAGRVRLVYEYCEGGTLYDRIKQNNYYPEQEARACCHKLLEACAFIHAKGVMHRDLKPDSIFLVSAVSNTDIKVSGFGLAKISRGTPPQTPRSRSIVGSDFYLAPEVVTQQEYGWEVDLWAVGVITYVLLSGSLPFFHQTLHKLYRQIVERDIAFPAQPWSDVSALALDFILRCLQVQPADRMTAEQAACHPWVSGEAVPATAAAAVAAAAYACPI